MRVHCLVLALFTSTGGAAALAQESPGARAPAPPLSLAQAVREAGEAHPALEAARQDAAALHARPAAERALPAPMLDARIWRWPISTLNPGNVDMYMFMVQQELPGRGKRAVREGAALRDAEAASAAADARVWDVVTTVKQAYATLRALRREIAATGALLPVVTDLIEASELAYASGRDAQVSVVRATLQRSRLEERLAALRGEERVAEAVLNRAIGRDPARPVGPLDPVPALPPLAPLEAMWSQAAVQHPELTVARAEARAGDAAVDVARAERRPDWVVEGGYMLMPGEAGAWSARVGITWPDAPWARPRVTAALAEADARRQAADARVRARQLDLAGELAEAHRAIEALEARLAVVRGTLQPQAAHFAEAARLAFAAGQAPLADVLDAHEAALEIEVDDARLTGALERAWAELERAVGRDLVLEEARSWSR